MGSDNILSGFEPRGAVTGIGSLPLTSAPDAIGAIAELSPEVPFWPQLPQLSPWEGAIGQGLGLLEGMIEPRTDGYGYQVISGQIKSVVDALHRSTGALTEMNAVGFGAFEQALAGGLFRSARAIKGQVEGPITLSSYLFHEGRPFLSDPVLFGAIAFHVSQMVCWQIDRLKSTSNGLPVLMFVDEPALCLDVPAHAVSEEKRLRALMATMNDARARGAVAGLHCCAALPFSRMCRAKPDILSFDAHEGLEAFFADRDARSFVRQGGTVAYGLVPTRSDLDALKAPAIFVRWVTAAAAVGDVREFARKAMITATCGLGLLDPSSVSTSFGIAKDVGTLVRTLSEAS